MPQMGIAQPTEPSALAFYLFGWGVFTLVMFIGTLRLNRALQVIFGLLAILFFLLGWGNAVDNPTIIRIAGIEGIICGHAAIYAGLAQVLNEVYGRTILPLGART